MSLGVYRTKTYIAADWTGDIDAVEQLYKWKNSDHWGLDFVDVHDLIQSRDSSLNCSIKVSLKKRLDVSKTFVLIVGSQTKSLRNGGCQYCNSYCAQTMSCKRGYSVNYKSFIDYECKTALDSCIKIVVLYNSTVINRTKCPDILRNTGTHMAMKQWKNGQVCWNYYGIKAAIEN